MINLLKRCLTKNLVANNITSLGIQESHNNFLIIKQFMSQEQLKEEKLTEKQLSEIKAMGAGAQHPMSKWKEHYKQVQVPMRTLADGREMPAFGMGTLNLSENEVGELVRLAIQHGYRLFDTSPVYGNERAIGNALMECMQHGLVKREELFIVSKLWITDRNNAEDALKQSLKNLRLDHVDLYLVHYMTPDERHPWDRTNQSQLKNRGSITAGASHSNNTACRCPEYKYFQQKLGRAGPQEMLIDLPHVSQIEHCVRSSHAHSQLAPDIVKDSLMVERVSMQEVWSQLEHLRERGLVRSIGVMNCPVIMYLEILTFCHKKPALNCIECHPYFTQEEAICFFKKFGCPIAAYAPIAPSENAKFGCASEKLKNLDLMKEPLIRELGQKYQKTEAQIILNWHMRQDHIVFPGMRAKEHFEKAIEIFEFELSKEDVERINKLNKDARFYDRIQDENYSFIPYWA